MVPLLLVKTKLQVVFQFSYLERLAGGIVVCSGIHFADRQRQPHYRIQRSGRPLRWDYTPVYRPSYRKKKMAAVVVPIIKIRFI